MNISVGRQTRALLAHPLEHLNSFELGITSSEVVHIILIEKLLYHPISCFLKLLE
jgi:hypothetical protein